MTHEILLALHAYMTEVGHTLAHFLPRLLTALLLLLSGFLIAALLRGLTRLILRGLRFNSLMERACARQLLQNAHLGEPEQVAGQLVFWLTWIALLLSSLRTLGIDAVDLLARDFVRYLPKLFSAVVIVAVGVLLSNFAWRASLLAAVNARVPGAKLIGALVRALTVIAAAAMALEQLEIGRQVIVIAFAISFGAVALALALAFGLGGRDLARRYLEQRLHVDDRRSEPPRPGPSHL